MKTLPAIPLCKGFMDSDTKEDEDKEVEEEDKNNKNIMPPKNKKLSVKVAMPTTPKKKKPSAVNSMDALAEGVCGLSVTISSLLMGPYALPSHSLLQILHKNYKSTEEFNMKYTT
jgi:hypothetical protein